MTTTNLCQVVHAINTVLVPKNFTTKIRFLKNNRKTQIKQRFSRKCFQEVWCVFHISKKGAKLLALVLSTKREYVHKSDMKNASYFSVFRFYAKTNFLNFFDNLIQCARIYGNIRHVLHVWHKSVPTSNSLFMTSKMKPQIHQFTNLK